MGSRSWSSNRLPLTVCVDEFIRRNADPIWLHQNEMWEYIYDFDEKDGAGEYGQQFLGGRT